MNPNQAVDEKITGDENTTTMNPNQAVDANTTNENIILSIIKLYVDEYQRVNIDSEALFEACNNDPIKIFNHLKISWCAMRSLMVQSKKIKLSIKQKKILELLNAYEYIGMVASAALITVIKRSD